MSKELQLIQSLKLGLHFLFYWHGCVSILKNPSGKLSQFLMTKFLTTHKYLQHIHIFSVFYNWFLKDKQFIGYHRTKAVT